MYIETKSNIHGHEKVLVSLRELILYKRFVILLLSLADPDIFKQSKFTDNEIKIRKYHALEKIHRQRRLKE